MASAKIKVLYDEERVEGPVTAVQITFWNAGRLPISASDILTPLSIGFSPEIRVLDVSLLKVSRPECDLRLTRRDMAAEVSWKILEKDDGGVVQIIFAGNPEAKFEVHGSSVGQKSVELLPSLAKRASTALPLGFLPFIIFFSLCLALEELWKISTRFFPNHRLLAVVFLAVVAITSLPVIYGFARFAIGSFTVPDKPPIELQTTT